MRKRKADPTEPLLEPLLEPLFRGLSWPTKDYVEETSYRQHNPPFPTAEGLQLSIVRENLPGNIEPVESDALDPLPPSSPLPPFPTSMHCQWSFDEPSRVVLANFRTDGPVVVTSQDEDYLMRLMERDDVTVVSEGLADEVDGTLLDRRYLQAYLGSHFHHKVKAFDKTTGTDDYKEGGWHTMTFRDYFEYLDKRQTVLHSEGDETTMNDTAIFTYTNSEGNECTIDVRKTVLYLLDLDMVKLLPRAFANFTDNFKLKGILPGEKHCMMNSMNVHGRPFMGPNIYITPPSSFTQFHQDGHGTVDSGHFCYRGYNEVVMLRRLPERHKHNALRLLQGSSSRSSSGLYGKPHDQDTELSWPTTKAIEQCKNMGYSPSCFILKPGQLVHINKGRLHAFRKLSPSPLQEDDCHHDLRKAILPSIHVKDLICVSVAWDWMFKGVTSDGINREVSSILECARLNQKQSVQSLAIPETSLLFLARDHLGLIQVSKDKSEGRMDSESMRIMRGILPSLQYVVHRHSMAIEASKNWIDGGKHEKVSIDSKPNAWQNPDLFSMDPYGSGDFICKFCSDELSNVYMHCDGCERLLDQDFNICTSCHAHEKYKNNIQMHPSNPRMKCSLNHKGSIKFQRRGRCPCKDGPACEYCTFCLGCSCLCHQMFTLHYRFMPLEEELNLLREAEEVVGCDVLSASRDTKIRLFSLLEKGFQVPLDAFANDGIVIHDDIEMQIDPTQVHDQLGSAMDAALNAFEMPVACNPDKPSDETQAVL